MFCLVFNLVLVKAYRGQRELRGLRPFNCLKLDLNEWHCSVSAVKFIVFEKPGIAKVRGVSRHIPLLA